jgi:hypothetical protein
LLPSSHQTVAIRRVRANENGFSASCSDCTNSLEPALCIAAKDGHTSSGLSQSFGHAAAQNPGTADDDGHLSLEVEQISFH